MSIADRFWSKQYAQRDKLLDDTKTKISISDLKVRGIVVVKKQTTTITNEESMLNRLMEKFK